jgi:purine nucleosidase
MPRSFIIDTDTASDDAVALLMALRHPDVRVEAITTVAGNVELPQATRNALYAVELSGTDVPVYRGADRPLRRELQVAQFFHGRDGLGDRSYPVPRLEPAAGDAAPDIATGVGRCVVMGGAACTVGNVTPAAEYNIWVDPEAADIVFRSGLPIEMVGWELCRGEATLSEEEMTLLRGLGTPQARFAIDCNLKALEAARLQSNEPGLPLPDPVAMAIAIDPTVCTRRSRHYVDVETGSDLTRGMTVVDALDVVDDERNAPIWASLLEREPNVDVCWEIDVRAWKELLYSVLR